MAWLLLLFGALCLFAAVILFCVAFGKSVADGRMENASINLALAAIFQLAAMSLLFAAGMMLGGA